MQKLVLINNAGPGITEFARPIEELVEKAGATSVLIETQTGTTLYLPVSP